MGENGRRRRIEPTHEWEQIEFLRAWPERRDYELIRPLVSKSGWDSPGRGMRTVNSRRPGTRQRGREFFRTSGAEGDHDGRVCNATLGAMRAGA